MLCICALIGITSLQFIVDQSPLELDQLSIRRDKFFKACTARFPNGRPVPGPQGFTDTFEGMGGEVFFPVGKSDRMLILGASESGPFTVVSYSLRTGTPRKDWLVKLEKMSEAESLRILKAKGVKSTLGICLVGAMIRPPIRQPFDMALFDSPWVVFAHYSFERWDTETCKVDGPGDLHHMCPSNDGYSRSIGRFPTTGWERKLLGKAAR